MTPTTPRYLYGIVLILVYNFRIVTRGFYSEKDAAAAVKQTLIAVQVNITVDRFVYIYIYIYIYLKCLNVTDFYCYPYCGAFKMEDL